MKKGLIIGLIILLLTSVVIYASENIMPTWSGPVTICKYCNSNGIDVRLKSKRITGRQYESCIHGYNGMDLVTSYYARYDVHCSSCNSNYVDTASGASVTCQARNK